jgi:hypothetical protein
MSDHPCSICREAPKSVERIELRDEFTYLCLRCGLFRIADFERKRYPS